MCTIACSVCGAALRISVLHVFSAYLALLFFLGSLLARADYRKSLSSPGEFFLFFFVNAHLPDGSPRRGGGDIFFGEQGSMYLGKKNMKTV